METREQGQKLGPTGHRVAGNVKALRGRMPVRELSGRLGKIGRPVLPSGITKIEQGSRRVDVDDLVALAVALDVSPNRLLLVPEADEEGVELTEDYIGSSHELWDWATGARELRPDPWAEHPVSLDMDRMGRFHRQNRPNEPRSETPTQTLWQHAEKLHPVVEAVQDAMTETGLSLEDVLGYVTLSDAMTHMKQAVMDRRREHDHAAALEEDRHGQR